MGGRVRGDLFFGQRFAVGINHDGGITQRRKVCPSAGSGRRRAGHRTLPKELAEKLSSIVRH